MNKREAAKLQRLIDRSVKAHNASYEAASALCAFAKEHYGEEPGKIDADAIIDGCMGGCGNSSGMTAEEFNDEMNRSLNR